ncbi:MAG TPA: hypothetical protein VK736_00190 [Candidatus Binatia bacterium]|nr:hypothetical protein [Candidatus Binatia bacterium]
MDDRFYVTVFASDRRSLLALQGYEFDLFAATAVAARARVRMRAERAAALAGTARKQALDVAEEPPTTDEERLSVLADQPSIDGLLTLDQIGRLVYDGYRVLVERHSEAVVRPNVIEFEQWVRELGEE